MQELTAYYILIYISRLCIFMNFHFQYTRVTKITKSTFPTSHPLQKNKQTVIPNIQIAQTNLGFKCALFDVNLYLC